MREKPRVRGILSALEWEGEKTEDGARDEVAGVGMGVVVGIVEEDPVGGRVERADWVV